MPIKKLVVDISLTKSPQGFHTIKVKDDFNRVLKYKENVTSQEVKSYMSDNFPEAHLATLRLAAKLFKSSKMSINQLLNR